MKKKKKERILLGSESLKDRKIDGPRAIETLFMRAVRATDVYLISFLPCVGLFCLLCNRDWLINSVSA